MNKKAAIEKKSLEGTINLLKDKNEDYENKIHKLLGENDRLTDMINEKISDSDNQRSKYQALERNKNEEIQELKDHYEDKIKRDIVKLLFRV